MAPRQSALLRSAIPRFVLPSFASLRLASQTSALRRPAPKWFAPPRSAPLRYGREEVRPVEVQPQIGIFLVPVPYRVHARHDDFGALWIGHVGVVPGLRFALNRLRVCTRSGTLPFRAVFLGSPAIRQKTRKGRWRKPYLQYSCHDDRNPYDLSALTGWTARLAM